MDANAIHNLVEQPSDYVPEWCNGFMAMGMQSISEHLTGAKHNLRYDEIESLTPDMRYRLHDMIHDDPQHPMFRRMSLDAQEISIMQGLLKSLLQDLLSVR